MKFKIQMIIEGEDTYKEEILCIEREDLLPETAGLTLEESKQLTSNFQEKMVSCQTRDFIAKNKCCACCHKMRSIQGYHSIVYRTLFGNITIKSPRFRSCDCQKEKITFSPLSELFPERTAPEFMYLQSKWASLISYEMTAKVLKEFLPSKANHSAILCNTHHVAKRLEGELKEEQFMFVEGCPRDWENLPKPDMPITVGIDGGYIHARDGDNRKAGWFEAIVGKSLQENNETKRFGFVSTYDEKSKRRLYEVLKSQGLQMNQEITFLSDGGDTVRNLQLYLSPRSEHILDWFHIAMRITNMKQMAKVIPKSKYTDYAKELDRAKWYLWHGNVFRSLQVLENLCSDLEIISE